MVTVQKRQVFRGVRNQIVRDVTEDKGSVSKHRQEVEQYYEEARGQGTGRNSNGGREDRGRDYGG